jgi:hypothetical protein
VFFAHQTKQQPLYFPLSKGIQDQRSHCVKAKHLAVVDIEDNSAILIARAANSS